MSDDKAMTTTTKDELVGSYRKIKDLNGRLAYAAEKCHLVSPSTSCNGLPDGCAVALSMVWVDEATETYTVGGGKVGLSKVALDKISAAAGISWDARQSHRVDDGSDPNYCAWCAVGNMLQLDGTRIQVVGNREIDLRPNSPQIQSLTEKVRNKNKKKKPGEFQASADDQIRELRQHILGHAETKARLRAVRSIGIRSSYNPEELKKPFVVARLQWTGQSDDPVLRREFALKTADHMLGARNDLYGREPIAAPARALPPPPMGQSIYASLPSSGEHVGEPVGVPYAPPTPRPATQPAQTTSPGTPGGGLTDEETASLKRAEEAARAKQAEADGKPAEQPKTQAGGGTPPDGPKVKFGQSKDMLLSAIDDEQLDWYLKALNRSVNDPEKTAYKAKNEKDLADARAEFKRRNSDDEADGD